jgi:hypothetical protein
MEMELINMLYILIWMVCLKLLPFLTSLLMNKPDVVVRSTACSARLLEQTLLVVGDLFWFCLLCSCVLNSLNNWVFLAMDKIKHLLEEVMGNNETTATPSINAWRLHTGDDNEKPELRVSPSLSRSNFSFCVINFVTLFSGIL